MKETRETKETKTDLESIGLALGRVPSGLYIVTFYNKDLEQEDGILISWLQQCSFEPPMLCLALRKEHKPLELIGSSKSFLVNIIGKQNLSLISNFYREKGAKKFKDLETGKSKQNLVFLKSAVAFLECNVTEVLSGGEKDHTLVIGKIISGSLLESKDNQPTLHLRKNGFDY